MAKGKLELKVQDKALKQRYGKNKKNVKRI